MFSRFDTVHQRDIQTAQARRTNEQTELEYCCGCHRNNNDDNRKSNLLVNRTRELKTAGGHLMPPQQHLCNGLARPADSPFFARECGRVHVGTGMMQLKMYLDENCNLNDLVFYYEIFHDYPLRLSALTAQ